MSKVITAILCGCAAVELYFGIREPDAKSLVFTAFCFFVVGYNLRKGGH